MPDQIGPELVSGMPAMKAYRNFSRQPEQQAGSVYRLPGVSIRFAALLVDGLCGLCGWRIGF